MGYPDLPVDHELKSAKVWQGTFQIHGAAQPDLVYAKTKAAPSRQHWGLISLLCVHIFLLLSPHHSSQAIRDLQAEVSQLRLRLEDSLHRPHPGSPTHAASAFQHSTRTQDKLMESSPSWGSHYGR